MEDLDAEAGAGIPALTNDLHDKSILEKLCTGCAGRQTGRQAGTRLMISIRSRRI